jgi:fructokinase
MAPPRRKRREARCSLIVRYGVDLGGTKIEAVALDALGVERFRRRVPTPQGDYDATVRAVAELVRAMDEALPVEGSVGVGTPGAISPATGRMKNANSVALNDKPLDRDLARAIGRPVRLANDADCFALSEATDGAAAGAGVVFGVIVGTGTGGGVVVGGRLLSGPNAVAGEWGHSPLPWPEAGERPGPPCYCGKRGCIETFLSGPGIARDHARATGDELTADQVAARALEGDRACRAALDRHASRMARALAGVINLLDPEVIVLGGGVGRIASIYEEVPRRWGRWVFGRDAVRTRLVPPAHGDASGVRGAAWLWPRPG